MTLCYVLFYVSFYVGVSSCLSRGGGGMYLFPNLVCMFRMGNVRAVTYVATGVCRISYKFTNGQNKNVDENGCSSIE